MNCIIYDAYNARLAPNGGGGGDMGMLTNMRIRMAGRVLAD